MAGKKVVSTSRRVDPKQVGKPATAGRVATYAAEWTCSSCGTTPISGLEKVCPNCAHPKDASEVYRQPAQLGPALTTSQLKEAGVDPDQHLSDETCEFCGAKIKPGTPVCPHCNGAIADVGYMTHKKVCEYCGREYQGDHCPVCAALHEPMPTPTPKPQFTLPRFPELRTPQLPNMGSLLYVILGIVAFVLLLFLLIPRERAATVASHYWKRVVHTEEYKKLNGEDWNVPTGATVYSSESRVYEVIQVSDGFEEQCHTEKQIVGYNQSTTQQEVCEYVEVYDYTEHVTYDDGTVDEITHTRMEQQCSYETVYVDVPVYDDVQVCGQVEQFHSENVYKTWYFYTYWDWVASTPVTAEGWDLVPQWPTVMSTETFRPTGARTETYSIEFVDDDGAEYSFNPGTEQQYRLFEEKSSWKITTMGGVVVSVEHP